MCTGPLTHSHFAGVSNQLLALVATSGRSVPEGPTPDRGIRNATTLSANALGRAFLTVSIDCTKAPRRYRASSQDQHATGRKATINRNHHRARIIAQSEHPVMTKIDQDYHGRIREPQGKVSGDHGTTQPRKRRRRYLPANVNPLSTRQRPGRKERIRAQLSLLNWQASDSGAG